ALLAKVAGSQVGGDALVRPCLLGVDDGCPDPLAGFAHPCAGESDDLEIGQMLVERYLNLDRPCLHADECNRGYFCEHESRVAMTTDKKWPVFDSWEIATKLGRERRPAGDAVVGAVDDPLRGHRKELAVLRRQAVDVLAHRGL